MQRYVCGVCLLLVFWASAALADQQVALRPAEGETRAAAIERSFDEALALEVQAVAGVPIPSSRLEKIMKVLGRERDSLILGYNEVASGVAAPEGGNATADAATLNVRIHGAGLKKRLRELGVLSTLSGPMPYVLHLSGVEPSRTKGLASLQELSGLQPMAAAGGDVPVLTLSQAGIWSGVLSLGEWSTARSAKTLEEVWLAVWKDYFSRAGLVAGGGGELSVRVSGWLSSMGPMEFDRLMDSWSAEVDQKTLVGVEMDGPGMAGVWRIQTRSRDALVRRLGDAAKAQGLSVEIR